MEIAYSITPVSGSYVVQFQLGTSAKPVSGREQDQLNAFGDMQVDFGGAFSGDPAFTLPTDVRAVPRQFPIAYDFDVADYADEAEANAAAVIYRDTIKTRIGEALGILMAKEIGTSGTGQENIAPIAP